jgi:Mitochondrial domain of unknown function (DUF1713)
MLASRIVSRRFMSTFAAPRSPINIARSLIPVNPYTLCPSTYDTSISIMSRKETALSSLNNTFGGILNQTGSSTSSLFNNIIRACGAFSNTNTQTSFLLYEDFRGSDMVGSIWLSSTVKKRRMKMNKHKLKKRRKALRMNTKASREA